MASKRPRRPKTCEASVPAGLRTGMEDGRLVLLTVFRALDRLHLAQALPPALRKLFDLDATLAEALWVLDQPQGAGFDTVAMTRDAWATLAAIPQAFAEVLERLSPADAEALTPAMETVYETLSRQDAYLQVPGRDPTVR
jgi:hypothetical protein